MLSRKQAKEMIRLGHELVEMIECLVVQLADDEPIKYEEHEHVSGREDMWAESKV